MKFNICLALILCGALVGWQRPAQANLGETYGQINARYGQPVTGFYTPSHDKSEYIHVYQINDRRIYVTICNGKSCCEAVRTPPNQMSEKMALAIATKISGATNWIEKGRNAQEIDWLADTIWARKQHHPNADIVFVETVQYHNDESDRENKNWIAVHMPGTIPTNSETNLAARTLEIQQEAAHILKSHQDLANQGDAYGELRMGLHYRDGDGVPKDLNRAREWLQKSADQGDMEAAAALAKLMPKPKHEVAPAPGSVTNEVAAGLVIQSARFGAGRNMADVTDQVSSLLRDRPDGFAINAGAMGADPKPGKKKHLTIHYEYKGVTNQMTIAAGKHVSNQALIKHANNQNPEAEPGTEEP